jgi:hypothetical protein
MMANARRCSTCGIDWPMEPFKDYSECAQCGEATDGITNGDPMEPDSARVLRNHILFDLYYAERERKRLREERQSLQTESLDAPS